MKPRIWLATALALAGMFSGAARAYPAQNSGAQRPDDSTIVSDINASLFADSVLKTRDIRVSSKDGVVILEGSVATELEKAAVDRIASTEPGVQKVVDSMTVTGLNPPGQTSHEPLPPEPLTVPAGTVVTVRMIDSIDSGRNQPGQQFDATVDAPVVVGSQVAIPKDSPAKVRLVAASTSGRVKGAAQLRLELISISVNGSPYRVESGYYEGHGASRGKRTATSTAGTAALGAMIGAIAGGGKGAAIGAGAGAGVGAGASAATKGSTVRVPSEAKIDFTLKQPVSVSPAPPS
jgi:BON domain